MIFSENSFYLSFTKSHIKIFSRRSNLKAKVTKNGNISGIHYQKMGSLLYLHYKDGSQSLIECLFLFGLFLLSMAFYVLSPARLQDIMTHCARRFKREHYYLRGISEKQREIRYC